MTICRVRFCSDAGPRPSGLAPSATRMLMPSASRMESSGGLVTWAKRCEKYLARPPS